MLRITLLMTYQKLAVVLLLTVILSSVEPFDCGCSDNSQSQKCMTVNISGEDCPLGKYNYRSNTQVNINSTRCKLGKKTSFKSLKNFSIIGNGVLIDCHSRKDTILIFEDITNLCLQGLTFDECGGQMKLPNTSDTDRRFHGALYIMNSTNVIIRDIKIMRSNGGGMYVGMAKGYLNIFDSIFTDNPRNTSCCPYKKRYGGGIYLDQLPKTSKNGIFENLPIDITNIRIENCAFTDNNIKYSTNKIDRRYTNHGGGMYLSIKAPGNHIHVARCNFTNNIAGYGGGLAVTITNCSYNSLLRVTDSQFNNNVAEDTLVQYGGGLLILLEPPLNEKHCTQKSNTSIRISNSQFVGNTGWIGGGLAIVGFCQEQRTQIHVTDCQWIANEARSGAAVSITRSLKDKGKCSMLPCIKFETCIFKENINHVFLNSIRNNDDSLFYLVGWTGPGTFFVVFFNVIFSGDVVFEDNMDTALSSLNCILYFEDANVTFINNTGVNGGAIALQGLSYVNPSNSNMVFIDNTAQLNGGAIFSQLLIEANMISAAACILQNNNKDPPAWNSTFTFKNNLAKKSGKAIYMTSLIPCQIAYGISNFEILNVTEVFNNTEIFNFEDSHFKDQVSTAAASIQIANHSSEAFPGQKIPIKFQLKDDLGNDASNENFQYEMTFGENSTRTNHHRRIVVKGDPESSITIRIKSQQNPHIAKNITINLTNCPLGYEFDEIEKVCVCGIPSESPITCNMNNFTIRVSNKHYIGLLDNTLVVSFCPDSFCQDVTDTLSSLKLYFKNASAELEKHVCSENRKGTLCGECIEGYTVYYNSPNFICKKETALCDYGWLFYIITTFVPLTLIFITITAFNVNLTRGSLRGFLLFCQIIVILDSTDTKSYKIPQMIWKAIYDIFRLRFFYMDPLSFCLKKNATALDMLSFQYIATVYALVLVCLSLLWISYCTVYINRICCTCIRITTLKHSFVTGFSALLILCYGSMATISMNILNTATIYDKNRQKFEKVHVYLQGNLAYFSKAHLPYALPAFVILSTIVIAPIILFLSCPLINKCFDHFNFSSNNPANKLASQCYLGGKLKPFYDTFQGCFKEKAQFFAGMYFLYQIIVIVSKIYPTTQEQAFFHTSLSLVVILAIHSLVHPYKKRQNNIIDTLLFTDLLLINSLSYYIYSAENDPDAHFNAIAAKAIQTILIFLPMLVFCIVILKVICSKVGFFDKCIGGYQCCFNQRTYYYRRRTRSRGLSAEANLDLKQDLEYFEAVDNEDGNEPNEASMQLDASIRKRQMSLSSFVANEQLLIPIN